jgi:hypothetical protein
MEPDMGGYGFPALQIKQPEPYAQQVGQVLQIKNALQQQQMGEIEIQNARAQQASTQALQKAWIANKGDMGAVLANPPQGALPKDLLALNETYQKLRLQAAQTDEATLKNQAAQDAKAADILQAAKGLDPAKRGEYVSTQLQTLGASPNPLDQNIAKRLASSVQGVTDWSDDSVGQMEAHLGMFSSIHAAELKQKTELMTAQGAADRGAAAKALVPSEIAKNTALTAEAQTKTAQAGQVTPLETYKQQQENYRATLARAATNANAIGRQGLESLQKQSDTYQQFLGTANSLKNSLQAASNGNEMAAAVAPLQGTLFVTTAEGVKRINETELKGVSGAGSLVQRINGALGKLTGAGPLSQSLKDDMAKLVDLYENAKYDSYQKQATYTQKLHGLDPKSVPILEKDGSIKGEAPVTPTAPQALSTGHKVGDTVTVKGKQVKIGKIYPDGSFDAE